MHKFIHIDPDRRLPELKKNCQPELLIYIVGSKADLSTYRQVTSDLARLSLHNWFPPPRPPTPPPPPAQQQSTLSYIRPRFTSFPGLARAPPAATTPPPAPETPAAYLDLDNTSGSRVARSNASAVSRSNSSAISRSNSSAVSRSNSAAAQARQQQQQQQAPPAVRPGVVRQQSRFGSHFGVQAGGWAELHDSNSSLNEDDENAVADAEDDEPQFGLSRGMELFEVSAKDDVGACR
jgi:hypothetical protein